MNNGLVDFHIHSNKSCDGDFPPEEIVSLAAANGYQAISIADHDTAEAWPAAAEAGYKAGVEVIPNIELTTLFDGREFHLLLPFVNWNSPALSEIISEQTRRRQLEASERIERLKQMGIEVSQAEVLEKTNGVPPLGVKIAQIILDNPANKKNPALEFFYREDNIHAAPYLFYKEYFAEDKSAYVPKNFISLLDALEAVPQTGGAPVLAHPGAYFQRATFDDIKLLKGHGLAGLEVYTFYHKSDQTRFYQQVAASLDLVPTAGSDFHGRIKPHIRLGMLREGAYWMVERLREKTEEGQ